MNIMNAGGVYFVPNGTDLWLICMPIMAYYDWGFHRGSKNPRNKPKKISKKSVVQTA